MAQAGLQKGYSRTQDYNDLLRQILLIAIAYDLPLRPQWLLGTSNALADSLSRFDYVIMANLCPH